MDEKKRVIALISGRGSNLAALVNAQSREGSKFAIVAVASDCDAAGLKIARENSIPTATFIRQNYPSRRLQQEAIFNYVREQAPDLIVLAGFMMIIPEQFTTEFFGKLINIHPSLLPQFAGLHTHERAIEAGVAEHGCTTHFVDHGVDTGPIIAQASCKTVAGETSEQLASRVLQLEHQLFPWTVNQIAAGQISLVERLVHISGTARESAQSHGFVLPELSVS